MCWIAKPPCRIRAKPFQQAVREALARADSSSSRADSGQPPDDLTRQLIADLLGRKLHGDSAVLARLEEFFSFRRRRMPERTKVQALVPEGGTVLHNQNGTAPGLWFCRSILASSAKPIVPRSSSCFPGARESFHPMFLNQVVPILKYNVPSRSPLCFSRVPNDHRPWGVPRRRENCPVPLAPLISRGLELGYCARLGEVDVRLAARSDGADALLREGEIVRSRIGRYIFGLNEED